MDDRDGFLQAAAPTAARPLLGLTILAVEDSRFTADGLRLLCLRSGARIRRADSLFAAERHLRTYRPGAVLVDLGLPDGSGLGLIARLAAQRPRLDVILAMSGDPAAEEAALAAGADGFLLKPVLRLAEFQAAILARLPRHRQPPGPRTLPAETVTPDSLAYREDLSHAAEVLSGGLASRVEYVTGFLGGLARSAGDAPMGEAVREVVVRRGEGGGAWPEIARLSALVETRLAAAPATL